MVRRTLQNQISGDRKQWERLQKEQQNWQERKNLHIVQITEIKKDIAMIENTLQLKE